VPRVTGQIIESLKILIIRISYKVIANIGVKKDDEKSRNIKADVKKLM
jgi:hypothetical protein